MTEPTYTIRTHDGGSSTRRGAFEAVRHALGVAFFAGPATIEVGGERVAEVRVDGKGRLVVTEEGGDTLDADGLAKLARRHAA